MEKFSKINGILKFILPPIFYYKYMLVILHNIEKECPKVHIAHAQPEDMTFEPDEMILPVAYES